MLASSAFVALLFFSLYFRYLFVDFASMFQCTNAQYKMRKKNYRVRVARKSGGDESGRGISSRNTWHHKTLLKLQPQQHQRAPKHFFFFLFATIFVFVFFSISTSLWRNAILTTKSLFPRWIARPSFTANNEKIQNSQFHFGNQAQMEAVSGSIHREHCSQTRRLKFYFFQLRAWSVCGSNQQWIHPNRNERNVH